jgi:hypothetical protein
MLKNKKDRPCECGSGMKYIKCCGNPLIAQNEQASLGRDCDECQACCNLVGVEQLGKPFATNCEHQCSAGCGIYQNRPGVCRVFSCGWKLRPDMPPELRPEKCGLVLAVEESITIANGFDFYVYEVWPGAFATMSDRFRFVIDQCLNEKPHFGIVYVPFGKRQETTFQPAGRYMTGLPIVKQVFKLSERGVMLADTEEEVDKYLEQLRRK